MIRLQSPINGQGFDHTLKKIATGMSPDRTMAAVPGSKHTATKPTR